MVDHSQTGLSRREMMVVKPSVLLKSISVPFLAEKVML